MVWLARWQACPGLMAVTVIVTCATCTALVHTGYPGWGDLHPHRQGEIEKHRIGLIAGPGIGVLYICQGIPGKVHTPWRLLYITNPAHLLHPHPLLQAWVFAAFDDEDSATLYYTYAFLYALPYLANGLELDGFAWLSIAVGVAHVQVGKGTSGECGILPRLVLVFYIAQLFLQA